MSIISSIRSKSKNLDKTVILPEAERDIRVIRAANIILENGLANPVLIGDNHKIRESAEKHGVLVTDGIKIIPTNDVQSEQEKTHFFKEKLAYSWLVAR